MVKLSIITINYNNAEGLRRTLASVASQTYRDIEHIIVDAASTDGSVDIIREYAEGNTSNIKHNTSHTIIWSSEKDKGIYDGMNKGIEIALGRRIVNSFNRSELVEDKNKGKENKVGAEYIQILNSGDILAADNVTERMLSALDEKHNPDLLYGNMVHVDAQGNPISKSTEVEYSLRQYYSSTINHDCSYIRRDVYERYGLYDENLKIVSDWKWFLQTIGLGNVKPVYVDIDVTHFDMSGISERNLELRNKERRQVLEELLPPAVLADYDKYAFISTQYDRLKKYHLWGIVYFVERALFKLNKWGVLR